MLHACRIGNTLFKRRKESSERCHLMTSDLSALALDSARVRKGTQVWTACVNGQNNPTLSLPLQGEGTQSPPVDGGIKGGPEPGDGQLIRHRVVSIIAVLCPNTRGSGSTGPRLIPERG